LYITRTDGVIIAKADNGGTTVTTLTSNARASTDSDIGDTHAHVRVVLDPVTCEDAGGQAQTVDYHCDVQMNDSTWINTTTSIVFQREFPRGFLNYCIKYCFCCLYLHCNQICSFNLYIPCMH